MSDGLNRVQMIGNLGEGPSMRYTANGKAVTTFRVAASRTFNGKQETEWVSVVTWEKLAEVCGQYLEKGKQVYLEGRLATRSWDGPDGNKRYKTEVVADRVLFLGGAGQARTQADDFDADIDPDDLPFE